VVVENPELIAANAPELTNALELANALELTVANVPEVACTVVENPEPVVAVVPDAARTVDAHEQEAL
tara:strand:- start:327 stop:527 length:201 start_codon:yes stop_codon:yes gene_type:complete